MNEMYSLTSTVGEPAVQWLLDVEEDLEGLMNVLDDVLSIIATAESKDSDCTTWQLRVQLASAILDLMMIDTQASAAWINADRGQVLGIHATPWMHGMIS